MGSVRLVRIAAVGAVSLVGMVTVNLVTVGPAAAQLSSQSQSSSASSQSRCNFSVSSNGSSSQSSGGVCPAGYAASSGNLCVNLSNPSQTVPQSSGSFSSSSSSSSICKIDEIGQGIVTNGQQSAILIKQYLDTIIDRVQGHGVLSSSNTFSQRFPVSRFADEPEASAANPLAAFRSAMRPTR
jgi:hypothetical protein